MPNRYAEGYNLGLQIKKQREQESGEQMLQSILSPKEFAMSRVPGGLNYLTMLKRMAAEEEADKRKYEGIPEGERELARLFEQFGVETGRTLGREKGLLPLSPEDKLKGVLQKTLPGQVGAWGKEGFAKMAEPQVGRGVLEDIGVVPKVEKVKTEKVEKEKEYTRLDLQKALVNKNVSGETAPEKIGWLWMNRTINPDLFYPELSKRTGIERPKLEWFGQWESPDEVYESEWYKSKSDEVKDQIFEDMQKVWGVTEREPEKKGKFWGIF